MDLKFTTVSHAGEIEQILALQARNLASALAPETLLEQGFLTVQHDPAVLLRMNQAYPSVIAKAGDTLAGYCLVMPREFGVEVPVLAPLFNLLSGLSWRGQPLSRLRWFVMGQICVAEAFRGQGVFDGMYQKLFAVCRPDFDLVLTEVAARNKRSLRAHQRVGFEAIHIYPDALSGETWHVIGHGL